MTGDKCRDFYAVAMCEGKERFDNPQLARKVAIRRAQRRKKPGEPYRCPGCNGFHIGTPLQDVTTRVRSKVKLKAKLHSEERW
jgi:predicted RNA-binding Zn-ribbon protein involved in translation (DUF1610 family)